VRPARWPRGIDIGIRDGRIVAVEAGLAAAAGEVIDVAGQLVTPPFVDAHFHMDATLSYGLPRVNQSGTLLEGIALWGELKPCSPRRPWWSAPWPIATGRWPRACWPSAATWMCATRACWPWRPCCT
jgi:hypothetical protein